MKNNKHLVDLAMSFYVDEPCRICGKMIKKEDLHDLVYAGYSLENKARSAHGDCWAKNIPQDKWVYSKDATD